MPAVRVTAGGGSPAPAEALLRAAIRSARDGLGVDFGAAAEDPRGAERCIGRRTHVQPSNALGKEFKRGFWAIRSIAK